MVRMQPKAYIQYQLKRMAKDLQRVPTIEEFTTVVKRYWIDKEFGSYNKLLESVGMKPNKEGVGRKPKEEK
jgi:hypothetical protein